MGAHDTVPYTLYCVIRPSLLYRADAKCGIKGVGGTKVILLIYAFRVRTRYDSNGPRGPISAIFEPIWGMGVVDPAFFVIFV